MMLNKQLPWFLADQIRFESKKTRLNETKEVVSFNGKHKSNSKPFLGGRHSDSDKWFTYWKQNDKLETMFMSSKPARSNKWGDCTRFSRFYMRSCHFPFKSPPEGILPIAISSNECSTKSLPQKFFYWYF